MGGGTRGYPILNKKLAGGLVQGEQAIGQDSESPEPQKGTGASQQAPNGVEAALQVAAAVAAHQQVPSESGKDLQAAPVRSASVMNTDFVGAIANLGCMPVMTRVLAQFPVWVSTSLLALLYMGSTLITWQHEATPQRHICLFVILEFRSFSSCCIEHLVTIE